MSKLEKKSRCHSRPRMFNRQHRHKLKRTLGNEHHRRRDCYIFLNKNIPIYFLQIILISFWIVFRRWKLSRLCSHFHRWVAAKKRPQFIATNLIIVTCVIVILIFLFVNKNNNNNDQKARDTATARSPPTRRCAVVVVKQQRINNNSSQLASALHHDPAIVHNRSRQTRRHTVSVRFRNGVSTKIGQKYKLFLLDFRMIHFLYQNL